MIFENKTRRDAYDEKKEASEVCVLISRAFVLNILMLFFCFEKHVKIFKVLLLR